MIKAFLFDYGGVITAGGKGSELSERLGTNLHITPDEASALLVPVWSIFSKGKISENEFWESIERQYGKPINNTQRNMWNKWDDMRPLPEMTELVQRLKIRGYKVGLVSNIIPVTEKEIRQHGGYDIFDFLVLSCEVGYAKPDPGIYNLALKHLENIKPSEVVFLDDQAHCLVPARELGMSTILVGSASQAIADVDTLLKQV